jgi:threonine/homoserine/homoserine lactone efflux protein
MTTTTLLAFALVAFIGIATPGPTVLLALTNGSRFGVRRALAGMAGAVISDFVLIGAVAFGLGALLAASEFWFSVVKWLGAGYLAFLGIMLLRSKGTLDLSLRTNASETFATARSIFTKSFLVAVTNPKGYRAALAAGSCRPASSAARSGIRCIWAACSRSGSRGKRR